MNTQQSLEVFMRMARLVVGKQVNTFNSQLAGASAFSVYDDAARMMNSMQIINHSLVSVAIKIIKKAKEYSEIDLDQLVHDCKSVISGSVADYMKKI